MKISGIYKIENLLNGHLYVGSSKNIVYRKYLHFFHLNRGSHHSKYLQNAFNLYGIDNFKFEIVEECTPSCLIVREQYYIDNYNPVYNISKIANSCLGIKRSEETKEKLSKIHKGKKLSEEHKAKISLNNARSFLGKRHSEETLVKMSECKLGKVTWNKDVIVPRDLIKKTDYSNRKAWNKGIKRTIEEKEKIRKSVLAHANKNILMFDWLGFPLVSFDSLKECSSKLDISTTTVRKCLNQHLTYKNNFLVYLDK